MSNHRFPPNYSYQQPQPQQQQPPPPPPPPPPHDAYGAPQQPAPDAYRHSPYQQHQQQHHQPPHQPPPQHYFPQRNDYRPPPGPYSYAQPPGYPPYDAQQSQIYHRSYDPGATSSAQSVYRQQPPPPPPPSHQRTMSRSAEGPLSMYWTPDGRSGPLPQSNGAPGPPAGGSPNRPPPPPPRSRPPPPPPPVSSAQSGVNSGRAEEPSEADVRNAEAAFDRFDTDNGNYLDLQEFMDALRTLHTGIAYHEAIEEFGKVDVDEDGRISRQEFVDLYLKQVRKGRPGAPYSGQ